MAKTFPMQPLTTVKGEGNSTEPLYQSSPGWLDGKDYKDVIVDALVLQNTAVTTSAANLVLETAVSPEGPWTSLATFGAGYSKTIKYYTSREGGTSQFERFIRWKIDRSSGTLANWTMTFRLCGVLKE